jgi:hypothetical protein
MDKTILLTERKIQKVLKQKVALGGLVSEVAAELLAECDPRVYLADILRCGCVSGMVSSLVRYTDTRAFYDRHYLEIEELRDELEGQGIELRVKGDLKNFYAWLAFEETARELAEELGLEW